MTDDFDSLDELASAHVDGELTDAEAEQLADDPELLARAAALGAVGQEIAAGIPAPDPAVRRQHLAAALDVFDALASDADVAASADHDDPSGLGSAGVSSLAERRAQQGDRSERSGRSGRRGRPGTRGTRGMPGWLQAAAVVLVVAGGLGWVVSRSGQQGASDAALDAVESEEGAVDEGESMTQGAPAADTAEPSTTTAPLAGAATERDMAAAEEDGEDGEDDDESSSDESSSDNAEDGGGSLSTELADDDRIEVARQFFEEPPSAEELELAVPTALLEPRLSTCAPLHQAPAGFVLSGWIPLDVNGIAGEALVYESSDGTRSFTVLDGGCEPFG